MDFAACRFMCCRENQRCCGCCFRRALGCNRMEVNVTKERERGPAPRPGYARPLNDVEREIVLADIAYLKQKEIDSGDRAKWEESQSKWSWYNHLRAINILVVNNSPFSTIDYSVEVPPVTVEQFVMATGHEPTADEMSRVNCKDAGKPGHHFCGWCPVHGKPRWHCNHH